MPLSSATETRSIPAKTDAPIIGAIRENAIQSAFTGLTIGLADFVKNGGDINQPVKTSLWPQGIFLIEAAVEFGKFNSFEWLIRHGAKTKNIKISGSPLLMAAIERHSIDICRVLLQQQDRASLASMKDSYGSDLLEVVALAAHCDAGKEIQRLVEEAVRPKKVKDFGFSKDTFEAGKSSKRQKSHGDFLRL